MTKQETQKTGAAYDARLLELLRRMTPEQLQATAAFAVFLYLRREKGA